MEVEKACIVACSVYRHPPVFGEWFLRTFPDPTSWYAYHALSKCVQYYRHSESVIIQGTSPVPYRPIDFVEKDSEGSAWSHPVA